jgi:hypothetical protein
MSIRECIFCGRQNLAHPERLAERLNALETALAEARTAREEAEQLNEVLLWHMREAWLGIGGTSEQAQGSFSENIKARYAASEARAAALESVGQRMHDLLDNENAGMNARYEENQPVCIWCAEKGYDGDGLRHHDNCVLVAWRTLTPTSSPATDEAQGEA